MPVSEDQLNGYLQELRGAFKQCLRNIDNEADGIECWLKEVQYDLKSGRVNPGAVYLHRKTPVTSSLTKSKKRSKRALSGEFEAYEGSREGSVEAIPETDENVGPKATVEDEAEPGEVAPPSERERTRPVSSPDNACFEPPKSQTKSRRIKGSKKANKKDGSNSNGPDLDASAIGDSHGPSTSINEHSIQTRPGSSGVGAHAVSNATFCLDESNTGNSTFVIEPRETKIERGTFVIEKKDAERELTNTHGEEVRKASDKAVLDAMSGPVRVTRTKARAIAQEAAVAEVARQSGQSTQSKQSRRSTQSGQSTQSKQSRRSSQSGQSTQSGQSSEYSEQRKKVAAVKAARKSIAKAKRIIASVSANKKTFRGHEPEKFYQSNRKEPQEPRVRCNSATEGRNFSVLGQQFKKGTLYGTPSRLPPHHPTGPHLVRIPNLVVGMDSLIRSANTSSLSQHQPYRGVAERIKEIDQKMEEAAKKKEEMLKQCVEAKAKKRQEKRQRVLSARDEHARERAMQQLQQERDREEKLRAFHAERDKQLLLEKKKLQRKFEAAEHRRKLHMNKEDNLQNKRTKLDGGLQMKSESEHSERWQVDGRPNILNQLDSKVMTPSHMVKKVPNHHGGQPTDVVSESKDVSSYDLTLNPEDREAIPSKAPEDYGLDDVCSDDSSDDEAQPKKAVPKWAQAGSRKIQLLNQREVSYHQMAAFFGSERSTPDLMNIFQDVDQRTLTRRSSAVWDQKFLTRH